MSLCWKKSGAYCIENEVLIPPVRLQVCWQFKELRDTVRACNKGALTIQSDTHQPEVDSAQLMLRTQEATLNAWPALRQRMLHGWLLRFSPGLGHRSNCIVPLYPAQPGPATQTHTDSLIRQIRRCENIYAQEQLQTVFRISAPAISEPEPESRPVAHPAEPLDGLLAARGYARHSLSHTLIKALSAAWTDVPPHLPPGIPPRIPASSVRLLPLAQWLTHYCQLTGMNEPARALHQAILQGICGECTFAVAYQDEQPTGCGMAVLDGELVGLFDIFTAPQFRQQGVAGAVVQKLLEWATGHQAEFAYLHVDADNLSALQLYRAQGFEQKQQFWYRIAP